MKKAVIVFDTVSGSTREMAEIIRDEMNGLFVDMLALMISHPWPTGHSR
jgi:flavodoxin